MSRKSSLVLALAALSLTAITTASEARGYRMAIFNANSGRKIFDDGRLDGRACAVGSRVLFNRFTGEFIRVPAVKCNF